MDGECTEALSSTPNNYILFMSRYIVVPSMLQNLWYVMDTQPKKPKMVMFYRGHDAETKAKQEAERLENK